MQSFDLIGQPWIPVRTRAGARELAGIEDALVKAQEYRGLDSDNPLEDVSIHRLLVAVLYDALGGPTDARRAARIYARGAFDQAPIKEYLDAHRRRFDLLDERYPFWQVAGFTATKANGADGTHPIQFLAFHLSSGTQATLWDKNVDDKPLAVTPDVAARWLLVTQNFRPAVGKSVLAKPNSSPLCRSAIITPVGANLFEALALSLVPIDPSELAKDAPFWRQEPPTVSGLMRGPVATSRGRLDEYTWLAQAIRLHAEETPYGTRVTRVSWGSGIKPAYPDGTSFWPTDPMLVYQRRGRAGQARRGTLKVRESSAWRDYQALVPSDAPSSERSTLIEHISQVFLELGKVGLGDQARIAVTGLVTNNAGILTWRADVYSIPAAVLLVPGARQAVQHFFQTIDQAGRAVQTAIETYFRELHSNSQQSSAKSRARDLAARSTGLLTFWAQGELIFREFSDYLLTTPNDQIRSEIPTEYVERIRRLAMDSVAITSAGQGRHARLHRATGRALNALHSLLPKTLSDETTEQLLPESAA